MDIKTKEERTGNSQHTFNHHHGCGMGWRLRIWAPCRQSLQVPRGYQYWEMSTHYKRVTHAATDNQKPSNRLFSSTGDVRQACKHLSDLERFGKRKVTLPALDKSTIPLTRRPQSNSTEPSDSAYMVRTREYPCRKQVKQWDHAFTSCPQTYHPTPSPSIGQLPAQHIKMKRCLCLKSSWSFWSSWFM